MPDHLSPAQHAPVYPDLPPREEMTTGTGPVGIGAVHDQQAAQQQQ
jgi:hypothetical protein